MSQWALFITVYLLGTSICLALGPRRHPVLCCALGFPIGLAVLAGIELLFLGTGVPFTRVTGLVAMLIVFAAAIVWLRRARPSRFVWQRAAWSTLAFVLVSYVITRENLSVLTYDSHYILLVSGAIARDGVLWPGMLGMLGNYGVFQILAHSLVLFTDHGFLWALQPMFAASAIAVFAIALAQGLDALGVKLRWRALAIAVVTFATFSIYMLLRHAFYIQTNFATATYLLVFCTLFWLSEIEQETSRLPVAFVAIFAVALQRIEGPLICVLFLSLSVLPSRLPSRALLPGLLGASVAVFGWYMLLATGASEDSKFLSPTRSYLMACVLLGFTGYVALSRWRWSTPLPWLNRRAPLLVPALFALALALAFALQLDHMRKSAAGWLQCLTVTPYWEHAWVVICGLALLGLAIPGVPFRWMFVCGIPCNMALILLLVLKRTPYYVGMGDSAARMAIHVVPLAFFYFGLKFLPLLAHEPSASSQVTGDR